MTAITIEQTGAEMALALAVHRNANIVGIRLVQSRLATRATPERPDGIFLSFSHNSRAVKAPAGMLCVEVRYRVSGEVETADKKTRTNVVSVDCTYAVDYQLNEGFEPEPKQVRAFKDGNVIFNCWPYFREYLQQSVQRMGLPPLTAPFLRVQRKADGQSEPKRKAQLDAKRGSSTKLKR